MFIKIYVYKKDIFLEGLLEPSILLTSSSSYFHSSKCFLRNFHQIEFHKIHHIVTIIKLLDMSNYNKQDLNHKLLIKILLVLHNYLIHQKHFHNILYYSCCLQHYYSNKAHNNILDNNFYFSSLT